MKKITHKDKDYIYGEEKIRDYPKRGIESRVFFIKQKTGYKYLSKYFLIYRTIDIPFIVLIGDNKKIKKYVISEIENYTLKSRRRKLKRLSQK